MKKKKIVIGVSGASGSIYAIRLLQVLKEIPEVEVHGTVSDWAYENIRLETNLKKVEVKALFDVYYNARDMGASIASGSFLHDGMVVVPSSMKTVAAIAHGYSDNLIARSADVCLKEGRKLLLVPRETPLSTLHLENLLKLSQMGVRIIPPMPAFYNHPETIEDIVNHTVMKIMDQLEIENHLSRRWREDA